MEKIKRKFTSWYYHKGYVFGYHGLTPDTEYFDCPWYVRPLLIFFSPSVYMMCGGEMITKWFKEGMMSIKEDKKEC